MKKLLAVAALSFCFLIGMTQKNTTGPEISIGPNSTYLVERNLVSAHFSFGATAKFAYNFTPAVAATVEAGYLRTGSRSAGTYHTAITSHVPVKAGFRYTPGNGVYFEPQLGATNNSYQGSGIWAFTYATNIGYKFTPAFDVSARYEGLARHGNTVSLIGLRIAYTFAFWRK